MLASIAHRISNIIINPFPNSKIDYIVYHGARSKNIDKFRRPLSGVWFAGLQGWVDDLYTADGHGGRGEVIPCWINVRNPYAPTEDEFYEYYGEVYGKIKMIEDFFNKLKKDGYDAYLQGGESDSIAVFDSVEIMNASTGKYM